MSFPHPSLQRWAAHSFKNESLILDKTTTSTGDTGMNLVLRQGALRDGEGYTFTLHITDLTTGEEGFASIDLLPNQPPVGGSCLLSTQGPLRALLTKVHFECAGESTCQPPLLLVFTPNSHSCSGLGSAVLCTMSSFVCPNCGALKQLGRQLGSS